ncbi:MAG: transcription-repair coupling factor (superfamily II helicase) [Chloroflexi bacterium]|nr:MAG: transcription-repair coupling factor (superfamily II helicase) [Chloroflexota bacterium]
MTLIDETTPGLLTGLLPAVVAELARNETTPDANRPRTLGVPDGAKAATIAALRAAAPGLPAVIVTPHPARARALADEIREWLPPDAAADVLPFPTRESLPYERRRAAAEAVADRLRVIAALAGGACPIIVTDVQALAQGTLRPDAVAQPLRTGATLDVEALLRALDAAGYRREAVVDQPGTLTRRGGIIDVFPPTDTLPLRIELFGAEIESLRRYDPATQRSVESLEAASIRPSSEAGVSAATRALAATLRAKLEPDEESTSTRLPSEADIPDIAADLDRMAAGELPQNLSFWTAFLSDGALWQHLPDGTRWIWEEAEECRRHAEELDELAQRTRTTLEDRAGLPPGMPLPHRSAESLFDAVAGLRPRVDLRRFATEDAPGQEAQGAQRLRFGPVDAYGARLRQLMDQVRGWRSAGRRTVIVSLQSPRLAELFEQEGLPSTQEPSLSTLPRPADVRLIRGSVPHGWALPAEGGDIVLLSDTEIFGFAKQRRRRGRPRKQHESFLEDLQPGDHVVHIEHGIGRFVGVERQMVGEREREYLDLRYAADDRLLVPTDQLHRLQRYVGPSDHPPGLTRLGTQQWTRAKQKVRAAVRELAEELLQLYAARQVLPGIAAGADTPWQMELEASFPYVETPDQLEALRQVKADMERDRPMDRIVVGDVGYGKTEVAVRAAFKAIASGRQVAMLVPTTVLAQQHFNTLRERTAAFPIRVEMLSRFRTHKEQRDVLVGLADGSVDMVIGTHRLLQADVAFKGLGIVIIDEEQRFGVAHKERLKRMRQEVDVLTLSATPIPRTLHMALSGIRDMSTIETPPEERLPITTYVMETDDQIVREAILCEIERGGQVYFLHNRVRTIDTITAWLRELVPEGRFLVGHGQMGEGQLEEVMTHFVAGDADVLVCTTIIESGLDIPNVNTIIIHHAQTLGLAQLYQLRGRVGRSAAQAYAYLLYDRSHPLSETAQKRLQTIFDATELGAGFQIALRDLEIRGTGNLLGAEQSGQIGAVGFELYTQLLAEGVEQLRAKQEKRPPKPMRQGPSVSVDLPLVAHIPASYIDDLNSRLAAYQEVAAIETPEGVDRVRRGLRDRYGEPPEPVEMLLRTVRLRTLAARLGGESLQYDGQRIVLQLAEGLTFNHDAHRVPLPDGTTLGRAQLRVPTRGLNAARERHDWLDDVEQALLALGDALHDSDPAQAAARATR